MPQVVVCLGGEGFHKFLICEVHKFALYQYRYITGKSEGVKKALKPARIKIKPPQPKNGSDKAFFLSG